MNSPCWRNDPNDKTTALTGWPSNRSRKCGLHATSNPQLDGFNGSTRTPACFNQGTHAPSEPSLDQLPPPRASTVTSGVITFSPPGVSNNKLKAASSPPPSCEGAPRGTAAKAEGSQPFHL